MHAFDVLATRSGAVSSSCSPPVSTPPGVVDAVGSEFGVSQPAVSQHLRVLRDSGFATVRVAGPRRSCAVDPSGLREVDTWLEQFRRF